MAEPAEGPARGPASESDTASRGRTRAHRRVPRSRRATAAPAPQPSVAALIVAHDHARRIAATVRAALAIPGVDMVLVVDDASTDNTQDLARRAGAVVVRHSHLRGRTAAVETGASVIAMRDEPGAPPRGILMLDPTLGHHAIGAAPLVPAVLEGVCDLAIALTEADSGADRSGNLARRAVERATGWMPRQPLGAIRCLTREAFEVATPLARGGGLEAGMTLDVLHAGLTITEVDCEIRYKAPGVRERTPVARANRYREVFTALSARRIRSTVDTTRTAVDHRIHPAGAHTEEDA